MKLLLLEQNKDKKGTLLETIVKVLLSSYGSVSKISTNCSRYDRLQFVYQ